jgi:hypothetical protein
VRGEGKDRKVGKGRVEEGGGRDRKGGNNGG